MVVFFQSDQPWIEILAAVLRMAICALLDRADLPMDSRLCGDFHFDLRMAVFAEHILGGGHRCVAVTARSLEISVRGEPAQLDTRQALRAQAPRTERHAASKPYR